MGGMRFVMERLSVGRHSSVAQFRLFTASFFSYACTGSRETQRLTSSPETAALVSFGPMYGSLTTDYEYWTDRKIRLVGR